MIAMALALEPQAADRRRADDGPRRHDPGAGPGADQRLTTETGTSLILITHDLGVVAGMTDRINVMYAGFIVETRDHRRPVRPAVPPVHGGAAALDAARRRARGRAADPDRGPAARHAPCADAAARSRRAAPGGWTGAGPTTRRCCRRGPRASRSSAPARRATHRSRATTRRARRGGRRPAARAPAAPAPAPAGRIDELAELATRSPRCVDAGPRRHPGRRSPMTGHRPAPLPQVDATSRSGSRSPRA